MFSNLIITYVIKCKSFYPPFLLPNFDLYNTILGNGIQLDVIFSVTLIAGQHRYFLTLTVHFFLYNLQEAIFFMTQWEKATYTSQITEMSPCSKWEWSPTFRQRKPSLVCSVLPFSQEKLYCSQESVAPLNIIPLVYRLSFSIIIFRLCYLDILYHLNHKLTFIKYTYPSFYTTYFHTKKSAPQSYRLLHWSEDHDLE